MLSDTDPSYHHFGGNTSYPPTQGAEEKAKMNKSRSRCPVIIAFSICSVVNASILASVACMWVTLQQEVEDLRRAYEKQDTFHLGGEDGLNETALELAVEKHINELREREGNAWLATSGDTLFNNTSVRTHKPAAHLTGSPQANPLSDDGDGMSRIKTWETRQGLATIANGMKHKRGCLVIPTDGLYFVYSQLYYRFLNPIETEVNKQGKTYQIIHYTFKKNSYPKPLQIMKSARNTCWSKSVEFGLYTSYQGGVFRLRKGDRVWVAVSNMSMVCLEETSSYFGAFMI